MTTPAGSRAWLLLVVSAVLEAVWASALAASKGFTELLPSVVFVVAAVLSMIGLGQAARAIPISTAYAVWTGLGAALTVGYAMTFGAESATVVKVALIALIVAAVMGLKVVGSSPARRERRG
ncbi:ligand-binding protein SH3 [Humibacillus sp. DSM 29435]|uniref:DMT family transporter n=1 Tax=Humibacillus sp. DSM 29435 TaxID=1869167 RepID=UPI000871E17D|nr:multidrug efflux SMR transporter [Humibacillus sp. DSM 29435]OFE16399.1 ligand-binding protein SH3 [Humibacillus sp. DSM 29435]